MNTDNISINSISPEKRRLLSLWLRRKQKKKFPLKKTSGTAKNAMLNDEQNAMFQNYMNGSLYVKEFPKYLQIELTNACNLKCIMCPHVNMTRKTGYMNFDLFKKIIDECSGNADCICLNFMGESFLNKKIFEFIEYASGKGMTLYVTSNATFLTEDVANRLLDSGLDCVVLSIDSIDENIYKNIRVNGDFKKVMRNVEELLYQHKITMSHLNICCQIVRLNDNENQINAFKKKWKQRSGLSARVKPLDTFGGQLDNADKIGMVEQLSSRKIICTEPWRVLLVGWDGSVVPCCNDYDFKYVLGNVNDSSLLEIWNSERMRTLRKSHRDSKSHTLALCKTCSFFSTAIPDGVGYIPLHIRFNPGLHLMQYHYNKGHYGFEPPDFQTLWTEKEFEFSVQDKFKDVKFMFCNENPDNETVRMKVKLFQKDVGVFDISGETEIFLKTPEKYKGRLLRYEFSLYHDWVPREKGAGYDDRRLGVKIKNIIN
ncbi:conserved hypothetical protein [Candidatus Desulfarcum epimagneticum]|uniref:Radical SAM core domain-containing protein n=1 Tax=uncultured Desulfobacteraceae bacterium TaxID=218296 RepID=A0A484HJK0_9BACT|nr:conserved hypothetical protein [uncultured Desulfobacteraceae bacterium]